LSLLKICIRDGFLLVECTLTLVFQFSTGKLGLSALQTSTCLRQVCHLLVHVGLCPVQGRNKVVRSNFHQEFAHFYGITFLNIQFNDFTRYIWGKFYFHFRLNFSGTAYFFDNGYFFGSSKFYFSFFSAANPSGLFTDDGKNDDYSYCAE